MVFYGSVHLLYGLATHEDFAGGSLRRKNSYSAIIEILDEDGKNFAIACDEENRWKSDFNFQESFKRARWHESHDGRGLKTKTCGEGTIAVGEEEKGRKRLTMLLFHLTIYDVHVFQAELSLPFREMKLEIRFYCQHFVSNNRAKSNKKRFFVEKITTGERRQT